MIILHFHLQPQFKYDLFHINFTSFHCTGRYELNKLTSLPMCGFIAQLVEHRTGIAEVTGFESRWSPDFFRLLLSNCLNGKINCDDHSSLSFKISSVCERCVRVFKVFVCSYELKKITIFLWDPWFWSVYTKLLVDKFSESYFFLLARKVLVDMQQTHTTDHTQRPT